MPLTAAQLVALKADIATNVNTVIINGVPTAINAVPQGGQNAQTIAEWYNQLTSVPFFGNHSLVPISTLKGCINWKRLTPAGNPDGTQAYANRALACQGLQFNLQMLLTSGGQIPVVDATQATVVQGFNDALSAVPSGAAGAAQDAGWSGASGVKQNLCRRATNAEKLFANVAGGTGGTPNDAATLTFEGGISGQDVINAWA